ncbi:MAG: TRAP transporter substrate-binding protein DctP [Alphaproteobacteria bacterium]|nr:TRAP transporter substrate-binding protein DctP [Alphaproteobacteria bacterium]
MKRRSFLKTTAAGGAIAASATGTAVAQAPAAPAVSTGRQEWRMVTSWPKGLPGVGAGAEKLAQNITQMSGGRLTVRVFAAGELVPALQCFDAVSNGTAEMGHDASYYHLSKSEGQAFFTAFPFGLSAGELTGWVHHGGGQALWDEMNAPFNVKAFLAGNTGCQMLGWFRREINTVDDLKGLKFRTPGNQAKILTRLGASVVQLPGGEIFPALQSGAIDGAEWIGPLNDLALGFHQVDMFYYSPGYHEPGAGLQLMVNKQRYDALPADLKAIVAVAAQAAHDDMYAEYTAKSGAALQTLVQQHGVQLRTLPRDVLVACGQQANNILVELMDGRDEVTKKIISGYLAYRNAVIPWTRVAEQAYFTSRLLPFPHGRRA